MDFTRDWAGHAALTTLSLGEAMVRLLVAVVFGATLGVNRERMGKAAGLRTHVLVTLGSALFLMLGVELLGEFSAEYERARMDPTRVLEGVIGGIGFLGAGSIIRHRNSVEGVTTSATVWLAGAIGAGCGLGKYVLAAMALGFALLALILLRGVEGWLSQSDDSDGNDEKIGR